MEESRKITISLTPCLLRAALFIGIAVGVPTVGFAIVKYGQFIFHLFGSLGLDADAASFCAVLSSIAVVITIAMFILCRLIEGRWPWGEKQ